MVSALRCGISIDEFWRLTPHEFNLVMRAKSKDLEDSQFLVAWHASLMLNCWAKKGTKVTPHKLLGRRKENIVTSLDQIKEIRKSQVERSDAADEANRSKRKFGDQ